MQSFAISLTSVLLCFSFFLSFFHPLVYPIYFDTCAFVTTPWLLLFFPPPPFSFLSFPCQSLRSYLFFRARGVFWHFPRMRCGRNVTPFLVQRQTERETAGLGNVRNTQQQQQRPPILSLFLSDQTRVVVMVVLVEKAAGANSNV